MTLKITFRLAAILFCFLLVLLTACGTKSAGGITVIDPYVRLAPPLDGGNNASIYMTLKNDGPADKLVSATTDAASMTMLHQTTISGDTASMAEMVALDLPANGTLELKPGGNHVMLTGNGAPGKLLETGQTITLRLTFASGKVITLNVPVRGLE